MTRDPAVFQKDPIGGPETVLVAANFIVDRRYKIVHSAIAN
jgi:hypothetical protein